MSKNTSHQARGTANRLIRDIFIAALDAHDPLPDYVRGVAAERRRVLEAIRATRHATLTAIREELGPGRAFGDAKESVERYVDALRAKIAVDPSKTEKP